MTAQEQVEFSRGPVALPRVEVRVLGQVEVAVDGVPVLGWEPRVVELVTWLATGAASTTGPGGPRRWLGRTPDEPLTVEQCRQVSARARARLGVAADGSPRLGLPGRAGEYLLHGEVGSDLDRFHRYLARAGTATDGRPDLRAALSLVRGEPFTGAAWWWVDRAMVEAVRAGVLAAVEQLAGLEAAAGDPAAAAEVLLESVWARWP